MGRQLRIALAAALSLGLMVPGLWWWQRADAVVAYWRLRGMTPSVGSVRCAGAAAIAAGEAVLLLAVVAGAFRRDRVTVALGLSALLVCLVSAISAVALGLGGR